MNNTITLDPRVSTRIKPKELVISSAIILSDGRLFVGRNHSDCHELAHVFAPDVSTHDAREGFFTSAGIFLSPEDAGNLAYASRQIAHYVPRLSAEEIF